MLHPHGLGRRPHPRHRETLRLDKSWVATGPNKNYIKVAATGLAKGLRKGDTGLEFAEQEYDALIKVLLGRIRRTMTPVAGELQARDVFPRGPEPG